MRKVALLIGLLLLIAAGFVAGFGYGRWYGPRQAAGGSAKPGEKKILYWYDPMHPSYRSDRPGIAPDCGMDLVPMYKGGGGPESAAAPQGNILHYRDPKQPEYTSDVPGVNPETGNDLEPVYEQAAPGTISVSTEKQQMIGVRLGKPEVSVIEDVLRAAGRIAADERRVTRVTSRTEGWVEKVMVDFVGREVRAGEPMLTLYSPELMASQQEYLLAIRARETLQHSSVPGMSGNQNFLVAASRRRLEHWGLSQAEITQLEKTQEPVRSITLRAPVAGVVTTRNAYPNQKVTPETDLYTLTDLSRVWVLADVFESDASAVRVGQWATVLPAYGNGKGRIRARVAFINPQVQGQTRTLQARLEADNPNGQLRPDQFVNVEFATASTPRLTIPAEALLDTGERQIVYVQAGEGHFAPRAVQVGERFSDRVEILAGLTEKDQIAVSGVFLLDSESRMKNPIPAATSPGAAAPSKPAAPSAAPEHKHD